MGVKPLCNNFGVYIDCKFLFVSHTDFVRIKLGKQKGQISKLGHYVPRCQPLDYYRSNIVAILEKWILIY